jgi:hypothetical protein
MSPCEVFPTGADHFYDVAIDSHGEMTYPIDAAVIMLY